MAECKACGEWFGTATPQDLCPTCERELKRLGGYVAPVRHGKWIVTKEFNDILDMDVEKYTCSACGEYRLTASGLSQATNYCPNCGAKMDTDR